LDGGGVRVSSPTQRTIKHLHDLGYETWVVEYWNAFARQRVDMWGCIDLVAIREGETLAVQTTSGSNVSARVKKITENKYLGPMRKAGWRVEVHGWRKGANGRYALRVVDLS
jgi:hypothetical protein